MVIEDCLVDAWSLLFSDPGVGPDGLRRGQ